MSPFTTNPKPLLSPSSSPPFPSLAHLGHTKFCTPQRFLRPEHHLWHHLLHSVQSTEFAPTPLPQHPHGHLPDWIFSLALFPVTTNFVFFVFIFSPLCSIPTFHLLNMSFTSSFDSAVNNKASPQSSSHRPSPLANLVAFSITVIKSSGLRADPWCYNSLCYVKSLCSCFHPWSWFNIQRHDCSFEPFWHFLSPQCPFNCFPWPSGECLLPVHKDMIQFLPLQKRLSFTHFKRNSFVLLIVKIFFFDFVLSWPHSSQ